MSTTELTIAIPTYNRVSYLRDLLPELVQQRNKITESQIEILVIDNASTDGTQNYIIANFSDEIRYIRNETNIGADKNFIECVKKSNGKYVWLFGDDEIINKNGIKKVTDTLNDKPDLIIAESNNKNTIHFKCYKDILIHNKNTDPVFPVHHTLITKNIFLKSKFNCEIAIEKVMTNYGHMYGIVDLLKNANKIIILSKNDSAFKIREMRAEFADPPKNLEKKLVDLNFFIANAIDYKKLKINIWLYYNMHRIYKIIHSKKINRMLFRQK